MSLEEKMRKPISTQVVVDLTMKPSVDRFRESKYRPCLAISAHKECSPNLPVLLAIAGDRSSNLCILKDLTVCNSGAGTLRQGLLGGQDVMPM